MTLYQRATHLTFILFGGSMHPLDFHAEVKAKPEKWAARVGVIYEQLREAKEEGRHERV